MVWVKRKSRHINIDDSDSKKAITEFTELPKCHKKKHSDRSSDKCTVHVWEGHNDTGGLNNAIIPSCLCLEAHI